MRRAAALISFAALLALLPLAGCGRAASGARLALPTDVSALPAATQSHLAIILLENEEATAVLGSPQAPYLSSLARRYAYAQRYYGVSHPSLPNYLALLGGSTFGFASDCETCSVPAPSLPAQLGAAGISWKAYMEDLPRPCDQTPGVAGYARKHDPFLYFRAVASSPSLCRRVVPYTQLATDLRRGALPAFVWITPNLCDDGHDCPLSSADRFLRSIVPALLRELGPAGALIVTFDEGASGAGCCGGEAAGGRVLTVAAGPTVRRGAHPAGPYDHYSTLRTIEDAFGLTPLGLAGSPQTRPLDAMFIQPPRLH
jgi:hypothetical protein